MWVGGATTRVVPTSSPCEAAPVELGMKQQHGLNDVFLGGGAEVLGPTAGVVSSLQGDAWWCPSPSLKTR